jgi:SAM-dependent methyltransferase
MSPNVGPRKLATAQPVPQQRADLITPGAPDRAAGGSLRPIRYPRQMSGARRHLLMWGPASRVRPREDVSQRDPLDDTDDPELIIRDWYANFYSRVSATGDEDSLFSRYMHQAMERQFGPDRRFETVLEVGGNHGEHVRYVRHAFVKYLLTDIEPPALLPALRDDDRITTATCDVVQLPYAEGSFDRVIATCLLHHVDSPLWAAHEMRRVTRPGGVLTILVPTDPGLVYRVGKALTSGRVARKAGLGERHRLLNALDHHNHFGSIKQQVRHAFRRDELQIEWRPWRVPSMSLNAFVVITVTKSGHSAAVRSRRIEAPASGRSARK